MARIIRGSAGFPVMVDDQTVLDDEHEHESEPEPEARSRPTADEVARRRDAVREAAREMEPLSDQDLRERLKGVTNRPLASDEISAFAADVRQQVLDDAVDLLDQQARGRLRKRRTLRLVPSRGYARRMLHDLSDDELVQVSARLRARGWDDDLVAHGLGRRLSAKRLDTVASRL